MHLVISLECFVVKFYGTDLCRVKYNCSFRDTKERVIGTF